MNNKNKADIALYLVLTLFVPALILKIIYKGYFVPELVFFTIEAALIGSAADWFAVTALFRKPLGFSWHTALVPSNREKLTESVTTMVEHELLSSEHIMDKLDKTKFTPILEAMGQKLGQAKSKGIVESLLDEKLNRLDTENVSSLIDRYIRVSLKKANIADNALPWLEKAVRDDKHQDILSAAINSLEGYIGSDKGKKRIYRLLKKSEISRESGSLATKAFLLFVKKGDQLNYFTLSEMVQAELLSILKEMKDPSNSFNKKISEQLLAMFKEQIAAEKGSNKLEEWKNGVSEKLETGSNNIIRAIIASESIKEALLQWLRTQLADYLKSATQGSQAELLLDTLIKNGLTSLIKSEHYLIGSTVKETMESFSNDRLVNFFEDKVGNDLQWIRINGTIVGGAIGLTVFLFLKIVYDPYIVPFIRQLSGI